MQFFKKNSKFLYLLFAICFVATAVIVYSKALNLNFWADDWIFIYLSKFHMPQYIKMMFFGLHPGELFISIPLIYVFGSDVSLWNIFGLLLRMIASLSVGLALYGITRSRKSFLIAPLLYVSYFGGLDAYTTMSWRTGVYTVILLMLSFYFCTISYLNNNSKLFKLSIGLSFVALAFDPMRIFPFFFLIWIWEVGNTYVDKKNLRKIITLRIKILSLVSLLAFFLSVFWFSKIVSSPQERTSYILNNSKDWTTFLKSVGSLTTLSNASNALLFSVLVILSFVLLLKKKRSGVVIIFCLLSMFLFFFPNWSFNIGLYEPTSRYFALPGVALILLVSYFISQLKVFFILPLIILVVLSSSITINKLTSIEKQRGYDLTSPFFQKQLDSVPPGTLGGLFLIEGNPGIKANIFDGSTQGTLPFAIARGIINESLIPYAAMNYDSVKEAVCPSRIKSLPTFKDGKAEFPMPLSKVYSWYATLDNQFYDNSDNTRTRLAMDTSCYKTEINRSVYSGLVIDSIVEVDKLTDPTKQAVGIRWGIDDLSISKIDFELGVYDKLSYRLLETKKFYYDTELINNKLFDTTVTTLKQEGVKVVRFSLKICRSDCNYSEVVNSEVEVPAKKL